MDLLHVPEGKFPLLDYALKTYYVAFSINNDLRTTYDSLEHEKLNKMRQQKTYTCRCDNILSYPNADSALNLSRCGHR